MKNSQNSGELPGSRLTMTAFQIMLAVADRPRHGYAIMQELERSTEGLVRLGPTTLYRTIRTLLEQGLIEETESRRPREDDERRRYYRLTHLGRRAAEAEAGRFARLVEFARSQRVLRPIGALGGPS